MTDTGRMRVLVTGASGFVGRHVLSQLAARGHEVIAVGNRRPGAGGAATAWRRADLLDEGQCRALVREAQADRLIHLAWYAVPGKYWTARENFAWSRATLVLLEEFANRGGKRAVCAGTCAEYDWRYGYCTEDVTPALPRTIYGVCKNATRQLAQSYCDVSGLELAWARIFFPYGPGEDAARLLPTVIGALAAGEPVRCSHGRQYRDFIHVADVAKAFVHLGCATSACGIFNVSSGQPRQVGEVVGLCVAAIRPDAVPLFGAIPVPDDDPPLLAGDNTRLAATGWSADISLADGIRTLAEQARRQVNSHTATTTRI